MNQIAFQAAKSRTDFFADQTQFLCDPLIFPTLRDYEDYMQSAIDALVWIDRAERNLHQAVADGRTSFDPDTNQILTDLYKRWLEICVLAGDLVKKRAPWSLFWRFCICRNAAQVKLEWCVRNKGLAEAIDIVAPVASQLGITPEEVTFTLKRLMVDTQLGEDK